MVLTTNNCYCYIVPYMHRERERENKYVYLQWPTGFVQAGLICIDDSSLGGIFYIFHLYFGRVFFWKKYKKTGIRLCLTLLQNSLYKPTKRSLCLIKYKIIRTKSDNNSYWDFMILNKLIQKHDHRIFFSF